MFRSAPTGRAGKTEGIHIGTSGSKEHALAVRNSLQLIPKEALLQHRFKTSEDIIKEFKHKNLRSVSYNKALDSLISEKKEQLEYLKNSHLAYMPKRNKIDTDTIYPEGLETVPRRFAIIKRNEWMIEHSDTVITYVRHSGGAETFSSLAKRKGKRVIEVLS